MATTEAVRKPRTGRWALWLAIGLLTLVVGAIALLATLVRSDGGTRWLLQRVPGLQVEGTRGALLDASFSARQLRWSGGTQRVRIDELAWHGAQWQLLPSGGGWIALTMDELSAARVHVERLQPAAASEGRAQAPASLRLPLQMRLNALRVGELQFDALEPLRQIDASLAIGDAGGTEHRIELRRLGWQQIGLEGVAQITADPPLRLDAKLQATGGGPLPWQATAALLGPLSSVDVKLRLAGEAVAGAPPPSLDAQVQLRPFEIWPLGDLHVSTRDLDLSALQQGAPRTRLTGRALIRSQGLREPVSADIQLDNALPGRIDAQGLPLYALRIALKVDPREPGKLVVGPFEIDAADSRGAAGRWSGTGLWDGSALQLQTRISDLEPSRLDGRLAPMRLSGPLAISVLGLPSPDPAADRSAWAGPSAMSVALQGQLEGSISGAPQDVRLAFEGSGSMRQIELKSLQASSGKARAQVAVRLTRQPGQRWQLVSQGELDAFEPLTWFPGPELAAWGKGPHRFSGRWTVDVAAPESIAQMPVARALPALLGQADLQIVDSLVAGLPFSVNLQLRQNLRAPAGQRAVASGEMRLASARVSFEGSGDATAGGAEDRTQLRVELPSLQDLAPLAAQVAALQAWSPRRGELQLQAALRGRWPELGGEVQLRARDVEAGVLRVRSADAQGRFNAGRGDEVALRVEVAGIALNDARIDVFKADLRGMLGEHRFEADLSAPLQPPQALAQALGWREGSGAQARLAGSGGWLQSADGGGRWAGRIEQLGAGIGDTAAGADPDRSWLDARDLQGEWSLAADGTLRQIVLQPGRAQSGPVALRWNEVRYQALDGALPVLRLQGQIEPFAIAPVLQRSLQGTLRWSGDLRVGATLDVRAAERFEADIRVLGEGGDLSFSDGGRPQPLGIGEAELRLTARDGNWRFAPRLSGEMLGRLGGEVLVRSAAADRWPASQAPIEGQIEASVPSLAALGGWLPPGWRLLGALQAQAQLSGSFGSPGYTGFVSAERVALRNLLVGVDLTDGALRLRLDGDSARVEAFSLRGGDGTLTAQGLASFGARPELQLAVRADKLRVLSRVDRQLVLSGQADLGATAERLGLNGSIVADSGLFDISRSDAPTLDEDVVVIRRDEPAPVEAAAREPSPMMRNAQVALDIDLGRQLRLRGRGIDTRLAGTLRVSAPAGRFAVNGRVRTEGGTYAAYGQKLTIERGIVDFSGPVNGARLDVLALRTGADLRVGVAISGSVLDPRVRLYSEPDLPDTEKLSWLVLGRGSAGVEGGDAAILQRAALGLLAGEGESPSAGVLRKLGIDEFSIRQTDGEVRETVVSLGKQVNERLYVGYERGVNATSGTWQMIYRIAQRFTLRAQSGADNSLDLIWSWRFGKPPAATAVPE